jgi:hypothetical protein
LQNQPRRLGVAPLPQPSLPDAIIGHPLPLAVRDIDQPVFRPTRAL